MRLHRFFVNIEIGSETEIKINSAELVHQVRRVFRLKRGDSIIIFNGNGFDYECKISEFIDVNKGCQMMVLDKVTSIRNNFLPGANNFPEDGAVMPDIHLFSSVIKKDNFEWIVEKSTEVGVTKITPVLGERSEKKSLNESRLKKISVEASEQSGRGNVPEILPVTSLKDSIDYVIKKKDEMEKSGKKVRMIAFNPEAKSQLRSDLNGHYFFVFIGSEGGWSDDEIDMFHKNHVEVLSLGPQVLRAETAVVAALSVIVFASQ